MEHQSMAERTNVPVKTTYNLPLDHTYLYLIFDTSPKGLMGIAPELSSLTDPSTLLIFPRSIYILDSSCPCRPTWARTELICMCSSNFSVVLCFWEATHELCLSYVASAFVTFMLVTDSWLNFCLLLVLSVYLFLLGYNTLPAKWPCLFSTEEPFMPGRCALVSSVFGCIPKHCRNVTVSEVSDYSCVSAHPSLCQWDTGTCSCLRYHPLSVVSQENTGHSPTDVVQCLGQGVTISVLIGLALRVCRLKKTWHEK